MKHAAFWVCPGLALLGHRLCVADQPTQKDLDELRGVIEANFAARNRHDLKGVLATFHPKVPQDLVEEFKKEAEKCFDESNLTIRHVSMYVNYYEDPWTPSRVRMAQHANMGTTSAEVEIVQMAVPAEHGVASEPAAKSGRRK